MRVPRIAGVDLSWAVAVIFVLPAAAFIHFSTTNDGFDAYNFELLTDFFFALLFFSHGVSAGTLISAVSSNERVNRYLMMQGVVYLTLGLVLDYFFSVNFLMILGAYYITARVAVYLDNQIVRFMIVILVVTGIFLYAFGQSDLLIESGGTLAMVDRVLLHLAEHHFNIVYWLPIFLSGVLFSRADFQSGRRHREIRLMAFMLIFFGFVLHVLGLRLFHSNTEFASIWGIRLSVSLPAFYSFSIGLSQLLVLTFERLYRKSSNRSLWSGLLNIGRLHLAAFLLMAVVACILASVVDTVHHPRLWAVLISMPLLAFLLFVSAARKFKDPLLFFSKVTFSKAGDDDDLQASGRR